VQTFTVVMTAGRESLREAILDAVDGLLARYGYQKMTMDDIAREAGVARRTIYLHFAGKEQLALASIDRVVERLLSELQAIACAGGPADERLRRMIAKRILFRFDSVQEYYGVFDEMFAAIRPQYLARREGYFAAEAALFSDVIADGCAAGVLACLDGQAAARTILLATNSLLPYSLSARELGARDDVEARVTAIADMLLNGLRRRS
jgi:AcrR family transcriptional regulator